MKHQLIIPSVLYTGEGSIAESIREVIAKEQAKKVLVFTDKGEKHDGLQDAKASACGVFNANRLIERICQGLQNAVNHDPRNRKGQLVFLI